MRALRFLLTLSSLAMVGLLATPSTGLADWRRHGHWRPHHHHYHHHHRPPPPYYYRPRPPPVYYVPPPRYYYPPPPPPVYYYPPRPGFGIYFR